jgi:hypothetical protein
MKKKNKILDSFSLCYEWDFMDIHLPFVEQKIENS